MKVFSYLERNATAYELAQRLVSLNYRVIVNALRAENFFTPGKSYLDVGCGTGFFRDHLKDVDYLGIDLNPTYIAAACQRRGKVFQVGDVMNLSGLGKQFDRILCVGLFHHLDDEQAQRGLLECRARLKPDGELYIIDALWPPDDKLVGRWLRGSDNGAFVRTLPQWEKLFAKTLAIKAFRPLAQWPFDYVFVRAGSGLPVQ